MGVGMLSGTLVMSAWPPSQRKIFTLLGGGLLDGLFLVAAGLRVSLPLLAVCGFGAMFCGPIIIAPARRSGRPRLRPTCKAGFLAFAAPLACRRASLRRCWPHP